MIGRRSFLTVLAIEAVRAGSTHQTGETTFDFHCRFWLNLHLVLLNLAVGRKQGRNPDLSALAPPEAIAWNDALAFYEANMIAHDFGEFSMIMTSRKLVQTSDAAPLKSSRDPLFQVLENAAPVYRTHWWANHHRNNQQWIDQIAPLVAAHEEALRPELARAYDTPWPKKRICVEMSYYLTGASAYTSLRPTLVTVSSWSKRNEGPAGLETLFHEAGHSLVQRVQQEMKAAEQRLGRTLAHQDLWHALMFYTTGELVRRRVPAVEPYAIKFGMWKNNWPGAFAAFERHWKPFLDGQGSFHEAVGRLVKDSQ